MTDEISNEDANEIGASLHGFEEYAEESEDKMWFVLTNMFDTVDKIIRNTNQNNPDRKDNVLAVINAKFDKIIYNNYGGQTTPKF